MKATELRIGNWIQPNWRTDPVEVETIEYMDDNVPYKKEIGDHAINQLSSIECYEPIPLTSEWLLKFGFGKSDSEECGHNINEHFGFYYDWHFKRFRMEFSDGANVVDVNMDIHYVHQLQNLYFALTGEELELKK